MGVFDTPKGNDDIIEIHHASWDGEYCRARKTVLVADREWVENQQLQIRRQKSNRAQRRHGGFQQAEDIDIQLNTGDSDRLWVYRMLVDWTFTKDGMSMPLTLEAVKQLPDHVLLHIWDAIQDAQPEAKSIPDAEGSENPTSIGASGTIDGKMNRTGKAQSDEPGARNFLMRS